MKMFINTILLIILIIIAEHAYGEDNRIKIGIIDSGISFSQASGDYLCKGGRKSAIPFDSGSDRHGHGTNVFGLIAKQINPKTHCIISYKFWNPGMLGFKADEAVYKALYIARKDGVKYVNMSLGGLIPSSQEYKQIYLGLREGITYTVAAGNKSNNLDITCNYFPACYKKDKFKDNKNFIVVGAKDVKTANYGKIIGAYEKGYKVGIPVLTGTSQATATHTGKIISKK